MIDYKRAYVNVIQQLLELHSTIISRVDNHMLNGNIEPARELLTVAGMVLNVTEMEILNLELSDS